MDKIYKIHENSWGNALYLGEGTVNDGEEISGHGYYGPRPLQKLSFIEKKNGSNYAYFLIKEIEYMTDPTDMFKGLFQYIAHSETPLSEDKDGIEELNEFCKQKGYK